MDKLWMIEWNYISYKTRPKKMNIPKFKQTFLAFLLGWKTWRMISEVKKLPDLKEVMDLVKLGGDLQREKGAAMDNFSKQIYW